MYGFGSISSFHLFQIVPIFMLILSESLEVPSTEDPI